MLSERIPAASRMLLPAMNLEDKWMARMEGSGSGMSYEHTTYETSIAGASGLQPSSHGEVLYLWQSVSEAALPGRILRQCDCVPCTRPTMQSGAALWRRLHIR